jgi:hypothetical protein
MTCIVRTFFLITEICVLLLKFYCFKCFFLYLDNLYFVCLVAVKFIYSLYYVTYVTCHISKLLDIDNSTLCLKHREPFSLINNFEIRRIFSK